MNFFNNKPAIEAHLLDIERALTDPDAAARPARLRDRIVARAVTFLADLIGKRAMELHGKLEMRVRLLEQRPTTPFFWAWSSGDEFAVGAFVTYRGCLWQSTQPKNTSEPGTNANWTLIVGTPAAL